MAEPSRERGQRDGFDVSYVGQYRCSARAREALKRGSAYVDSPMVDWYLYGEFAEYYRLDTERDNKSVWDPRWLVRGLARFGSTVPSSLAEKFVRDRPTGRDSRRVWEPGTEGSQTKGAAARSSRTGGGPTSARSQGSPTDWDVVGPGRVRLAVRGDLHNRGVAGPRFDPVVYGQAKAATYRVAGGGPRRFPPLEVTEVVEHVLHTDKSAGAPYFSDVATAIPRALEFADRIRRQLRAFDPYVAYRRIQHGSGGPKGRLVWGSPLATTILASRFAKAAYQGLIRKHVFAYGYQKSETGAYVSEFQSRWKRSYCVDFSGFDSSIPAFVIGDAFEILKTHLQLSAEDEELFYRLTNDFIHARIILPDGSVYQKHRGIPSGSPFTSMIGSICNLLVLNYTWIKLTGAAIGSDRCLVLGDDSVVATNANPSLADVAEAAADLGMVVDVNDSKVATIKDRVVFLGHEWENGRPHRPARDVIIRMVFEEKHRPLDRKMTCLRLYGFTSDCEEAYDIVMELIHDPRVPLDVSIQKLAAEARGSPLDLSKVGSSRLRYLLAHEPHLLVDNIVSNGKLAALGLFRG